MASVGLLNALSIEKVGAKTVTGKDILLPYHKIKNMFEENSKTVIIIDDTILRKKYVSGKTLAAIEAAAAAYVEPAAKFTEFTVTKINGKIQPSATTKSIGEHLILEALDIPSGGMILKVENGTVYPTVYEVSEQKATLTTTIDVA